MILHGQAAINEFPATNERHGRLKHANIGDEDNIHQDTTNTKRWSTSTESRKVNCV